jgi:glycosyltransferase involved in cell wall biosynthesis
MPAMASVVKAGPAIAACTIISKNYLSLARVWNESFRRHHPGARTFVLLVDRIDGAFDPSREEFDVITVDELKIPGLSDFTFKYNILELNTAVKPFFLDFLLRERGVERILYFDPDVLVLGPVTKVQSALETANIVLTPHTLSPLPADRLTPSEVSFLISGAYNLGFIGLRKSPVTLDFLNWWQNRLHEYCLSAPEKGLFTDQKWIDLVPGLFSDVEIIRDRGYNVAYWNLHERGDPVRESGCYSLGESPIAFFHFSGLDHDRPELISRYQTRFRLRHLNGAYRHLFADYGRAVREAGFDQTRHWRYAFASFDDGVLIPDLLRRFYQNMADAKERWPDPFSTKGPNTFRGWLLEPARFGSRIPRLLSILFSLRPDLQEAFPDAERTGAVALLDWAILSMPTEYKFGDFFIQSFRERKTEIQAEDLKKERHAQEERSRIEREKAAAAAAIPTPEDLLAQVYYGLPKKKWKQAVKKLLGDHLYHKVRSFLWYLRRFHDALRQPPPPRPRRTELVVAEPARVPLPFGVNLFGYLDTESGVGEIARSFARMLRRQQIPHSLLNVEQRWLRRLDRTFTDFAQSNPYSFNLFFINADQVPGTLESLGPDVLGSRKNIGYWFWELSTFPEALRGSFRYFDEIWVASSFCLEGISASSPVPVVKIPPGFDFHIPAKRDRKSFGIGEDDFVFLYVFDGASSFHRKNAGGLVSAFRRAFPSPGSEKLILKMTNAPPSKIEGLRRLAGDSRLEILSDYLKSEEILDLLAAADCYVSLHRSEGFGLTILESLAMGKPVIATDYSGSKDFLNGRRGFPVSCELVPLRRNLGPYKKGSVWAQPDMQEAAAKMRWVRTHPAEVARVAHTAQREIASAWSLSAAGKGMMNRLNHLSAP